MSVDSRHPQYQDCVEDWVQIRDTYRGERRIKDKGTKYLPATSGQLLDGMNQGQKGLSDYIAYKNRARFPDSVSTAIEGILGIMHNKPPMIELPAKMEPLREKATADGQSLETLLVRINLEQLVTGRVGLMCDVPDKAPVGALPYICMYAAESIINWDDGAVNDPALQNLNLVVLNESEYQRTSDFEWEMVTKYRVVAIGDLRENESEQQVRGQGFRTGVFSDHKGTFIFSEDQMVTPSVGGKTFDEIPFVFVNTKDLVPTPDDPPLLGLSNIALAIYRGDADYRQALYMQAQDTLVIIGTLAQSADGKEGTIRAGAGAAINVQENGDAKYIGTESQGIPEMRHALQDLHKEAAEIGGKLLETRGKEAESGEALKIRVSARTASINQVAMTGAEGLQMSLRMIARWLGEDPEKVVVKPNTDFSDSGMTPKELFELVSAKAQGLPLSSKSVHAILVRDDYTSLTEEEEQIELQKDAEKEAERLNGSSGGLTPEEEQEVIPSDTEEDE